MSIQVYERVNPLREAEGFRTCGTAMVRWLCQQLRYIMRCLSWHSGESQLQTSTRRRFFPGLRRRSLLRAARRFTIMHGSLTRTASTHIVAAYWVDRERRDAWISDQQVASWWSDPVRLSEATGYFRESLTIPIERQETLYWQDYPAGLSRSPDVAIYPTPYCGYYGAMRDRIPLAAVDALAPAIPDLPSPQARSTQGARWRIATPHNMAVIRSAAFWGRCDPMQTEDYMRDLRTPLERGMDYLRESPSATGCCSLRFQQTCDAAGTPQLETHALGYFLSLGHMENWAERHPSHEAIFSAAIARYRKYGKANQLRTWHEVFVLPGRDQTFEIR